VVNHRVSRIKRAINWAVAEELIPPFVHHGLQAVTGLGYGRTGARETQPVRPVPDEHVDAVFPFLPPQIAAMIQLQRLTGMRPGEVVKLRACDIDRSGEIWIYERRDHKNRWRGHRRMIPIGPRG
jgi:integrase